MTHLRRYLEQTGAIAPEHLDAALRRQQIYGGSLDTVLLELELVDPQTLGELMAQACGLPVAPIEMLEGNRELPWGVIPDELVDIGWAVPLSERDGIIVAVHPDLPNERLGELYRAVRGVSPMVTPECCIERLAAQRNHSVVPQRYAVLAASYLSALRRRPSVTDSRFPLLPELGDDSRPLYVGDPHPSSELGASPSHGIEPPAQDTRVTQTHARSGVVRPPSWDAEASSDGFEPATLEPLDDVPARGMVAEEPEYEDAVQDEVDREDSAIPQFIEPGGAGELSESGPLELSPDTIIGAAPPVRFGRGDDEAPAPSEQEDPDRLEGDAEEELALRISGAMSLLAQATHRDMALDALVRAAMVIAPRVGLFRIRRDELVGLPTPRSALPDLENREIPLREGSELEEAVAAGRWRGSTRDEALNALMGLDDPVPSVLNRIDVAGRPIMLLYADLEGEAFTPAQGNLLDELCDLASETFENILKSRRSPSEAAPERPVAEPGTPSEIGWNASHEVRDAYADDEAMNASAGPASRRDTTPDGSAGGSDDLESSRPPILTLTAMPPPPPLPPPPPMGEDDEEFHAGKRHKTLMGLPTDAQLGEHAPEQPSHSVFTPPPLEGSGAGIVSLSSPIDQPTIRGRISLDDEDWDEDEPPAPSEAARHRIDAMLRAISAGDATAEDLESFGEPAFMRLAAQFPGPLEVLRRDLRALPPPSAHGPLLRASIGLGGAMVPHLLDLFDHPDADVRFYAAFVFQELRDPRCMQHLAELAFDHSGDVRVIAMRVLETYNRHAGFDRAVTAVRTQLDSTNRTRQLYAARAVGTLRDGRAIGKLIDLLASRDRFIQEAALESLCSITGQQHGLKPHRWKQWYAEHGHQHRVEWIIGSLRHRDLPVRRWASDELTRITGHRIAFSALGDRQAREVAVEAWTDWWNATGRGLFEGTRGENVG